MIGIILLDTKFPRLPGDVGSPGTFAFPVLFERVKGAVPSRVVKERDRSLISGFVEAAKVLEKRGAKAITASCGFLALWQKEISTQVEIPVFTSSLLQVPWAYQITGRRGRIGVLTVDEASLTREHFEGAGAGDIPCVVRGMKAESEFCRVFVGNNPDINVKKAEGDVAAEVAALTRENLDVAAVVLECTNMPVFGKAVRKAVDVPVFDIVTLTNYVWTSIRK